MNDQELIRRSGESWGTFQAEGSKCKGPPAKGTKAGGMKEA